VRLRAEPGFEGEILADILVGKTVRVIDLPVCATGFLWWKVRTNNNQVGWMAEGEAALYYLEPVQPPE
jgi:hypothetical protein